MMERQGPWRERRTDAGSEAEQGDASYRILDQVGPACAEQGGGLDVGAGVVTRVIVPVGEGGRQVSINDCDVRDRSGLVPCHGESCGLVQSLAMSLGMMGGEMSCMPPANKQSIALHKHMMVISCRACPPVGAETGVAVDVNWYGPVQKAVRCVF